MDLSLWSIKNNNWSAENFKKTHHLNELYTWTHDTDMSHWSPDILFWQLSIDHNMGVQYQV